MWKTCVLSFLLKKQQTKRKLKEVIHADIGGYAASTASKQKQHPKLVHEIKLLTCKREESK